MRNWLSSSIKLPCMSCKMKMLLTTVVLFIFCGLVVVVLSAVVVNSMKNELVRAAETEIRELHMRATEDIRTIIEDYRAQGFEVNSLQDVANNPEIKAQFRLLSSQDNVVLTALVNSDGTCIYQYGDEKKLHDCPTRSGSALQGFVPPSDEPLRWELNLISSTSNIVSDRVPIKIDEDTANEKILGYVEFGFEQNASIMELKPLSQNISRSLMYMVALVLFFFGLALTALYRLGQRQIVLQKVADDAEHMANIGTMASGLAHEIRNPLHAMNLHLEAAREEMDDPRPDSPEKLRETINRLQNQIQNMNTTVSHFMNFANPGRIEPEPQQVSCLLAEVIQLLKPDLESRRVEVEQAIAPELWINADPTASRQVITNVLLNAAQAMESSERRLISIRTQKKEQAIRLIFEDSGPGIPAGKEESIFDLFVSTKKGGSGFGLAIAKRIMQAHQGNIFGENRTDGPGARFILEFREAANPSADPGKPQSRRNDSKLVATNYEEGLIG
ncbi:MAG: HAMP domain-containing sensor histidine kinase [Candidatus Sumerlaeia bacterium]|nr:HAMP domain-containing sensor histidine kinase [Candidatus Sumerlaeia bacterium]